MMDKRHYPPSEEKRGGFLPPIAGAVSTDSARQDKYSDCQVPVAINTSTEEYYDVNQRTPGFSKSLPPRKTYDAMGKNTTGREYLQKITKEIYEDEINDLKRKLIYSDKKIKNLEDKNDHLESKNSIQKDELADLRKKVSGFRVQIRDLEKKKSDLTRKNENLEQWAHSLELRLKSLENNTKDLRKSQEMIREDQNRIENGLETERRERTKDIGKLNNECANINKRLDNILTKKDLDSMGKRLDSMETDRKNEHGQLLQCLAEISKQLPVTAKNNDDTPSHKIKEETPNNDKPVPKVKDGTTNNKREDWRNSTKVDYKSPY